LNPIQSPKKIPNKFNKDSVETNMKKILCLLVLALSSCSNPQQAKQTSADIPSIPFEKYTLPNGLDVVLVEDHRTPVVAVNIWYHVGPAHEAAGQTGFAHLFEHLMFAGSKHVPRGAADKLLEGAGVTDSNGTTDFDRTNYFDTVPANQLELALWIHSDRLGYLLEEVDQIALSNQQDVVRNERRQSVENRPYGIVDEAIYQNLFPKTHPYYASVIGSHADIQSIKLEDVKKFFKQYYSPNNASLVLVGDFKSADAKKQVEKYFASIKRGPDVPKLNVVTPAIEKEKRTVITDRIELPQMNMAWITPQIFKTGDADMDIASQILGGGKSSRLYKKLVYEKQIAQSVSASQQSLMLGSVFSISATARPGHTAEELEKAIDEELQKLRNDGPDQKEVDRARNLIETGAIQGLEKVGGFGGVANRLNTYNHFLGDPGYLAKDIGRYREVTPSTVKQIAQQYLPNTKRIIVVGLPGEQKLAAEPPTPKQPETKPGAGAESVNVDEAWRATQPGQGPDPKISLPTPSSFKLQNGLTVYYSERSGLPLVSANLILRGGGDVSASQPGLASFMAGMLSEGTQTRNALQIADEVAYLGASIGAGSGSDSTFVAGSALKKNFPALLDLMSDVALRPSFPAAEIERERASRLASLVQSRDDANVTAGRVLQAALYGDKHPYGFSDLGTEAAIKATKREDLQALWSKIFVPNNAALVVAGNISGEELKALAEKYFGAWKSGALPERKASTPVSTKAKLVLVDKPGAPQTAIRVATLGPARVTPDYEKIQVMNAALGGSFTSRINNNLREEKGYSYGVYSGMQYQRQSGTFAIRGSVRTDVTTPALQEIFKEVKGITSNPPDAKELSRAIGTQMLSLPGQFDTGAATAGAFASLFTNEFPLDYYSKIAQRFGAVTQSELIDMAKKYVAPENLIVVAVGDKKKIEADLAKLNLGQAEYRDADGALLKN
jgi:zinc protease